MPNTHEQIRRDPRYRPRAGSCKIVFEHPVSGRRFEAALEELGIAGFSFIVEERIEGMSGATLTEVQLKLGDCILTGDYVVKHTEPRDHGKVFFGGLFLPANQESALRLEGILHGLQVADPR